VVGLARGAGAGPDDEITVNRRAGDTIDWREGGNGRVAAVNGVAASHDALRMLMRQLARRVQIRGETAPETDSARDAAGGGS
jgi:hypothetical protein